MRSPMPRAWWTPWTWKLPHEPPRLRTGSERLAGGHRFVLPAAPRCFLAAHSPDRQWPVLHRQHVSIGFRVVPVTVLLGLLVWGGYTLAFLLVFRTLDLLEQHPPEALVLAFAWGGLGAVYFAAPANI